MMEQEKKNAGWFYHHPDYLYNCAQAIAHSWSGEEGLVSEMNNFGSGRAVNGQCGALYASKRVAERLNLDGNQLEHSFFEKAGSLICREIRARRVISCRQCVEIAHNILEELVEEQVKRQKGMELKKTK